MSHASPFAVIPEEVKEKVSTYGWGLLSSWSPQQTILSHPVSNIRNPSSLHGNLTPFQVTGWFVTHGGQNSVIEAIAAGVPM